MTDKLSTAQRDIVYLAACALNGEVPDKQKICETNLTSLYHLAKRHSMSAIIYMALDSAKILDTDND